MAKLSFRQGIVDYPEVFNPAPNVSSQRFLQLNGSVVDFVVTNGPTSITFAHRDTDYLYSEGQDVPGAWGPFVPAASQLAPAWMFWDVDRATGQISRGHTRVEPVFGPMEPTNPVADQHWFDTLNAIHYVRENNNWTEVIRVFAARFNGATPFQPMSTNPNNAKAFAGTQVGLEGSLLSSPIFAGLVIFDESGLPVTRSSNGTFFTTETEFFNGSTRVNGIRLESDVIPVTLNQVTPSYYVVKFVSAGHVAWANYNDSGEAAIGITTQEGIINDVVNIVAQGIITNEGWNWPLINIGDPLYIRLDGQLVIDDPNVTDPGLFPIPQVPVGRIIGPRQIIFMQGLGGVGPQGPAGDISNLPFASSTLLGATFLDVDPDILTLPIAVGVNSPLLAGAPFAPLSHLTSLTAHPSDNITVTPAGNITSTDVQDALEELDALITTITAGLDPKESVRAATVIDISAVYAPGGGTGGTGAFSGAPSTVDGVTILINNRVLVKDQSDPLQNGIYSVVSAGNWERSDDLDGSPPDEVSAGAFTFVEQGAVNINTGWLLQGSGNITLNTDPLVWVRFGGNFVTLDHLTNSNAHTAANITNVPAASGNFGTPTTTADVLAIDVQGAVDELLDEKAQRTPAYTVLANLPTAASSEGMVAWVTAEQKLYVSDGSAWEPLVREDLSIPYDLNFFIGGIMTAADAISGSYIATRVVTIPINATGSRAFANTVPVGNFSYVLQTIPSGGGAPTVVGSIDFLAALGAGTFTVAAPIVLAVGEQLQIVNPNPVDANVEDVVINIVGSSPLV